MMPKVETFDSPDHRFRLTVTPRALSSQLGYFDDKVKHREPAGQAPGATALQPRGVLERAEAEGRWSVVWDRPLVNDVAPVSGLVSPSGLYVVTFDNWHSMGHGENVVVIYGPRGNLVRSLTLGDFLPDYWIKALPHSVNSLWWSGEHQIDAGDRLILRVVIPSETDDTDKLAYAEVAIRLADGQVERPEGKAWAAALAKAARVADLKRKADERDEAAFLAPLPGPSGTDELGWHLYLQEAFFRADPNWQRDYPIVVVLRAPAASDYAPSEGFLRGAFHDEPAPSKVMMFASPSSIDNLVRLLRNDIAELKPGTLAGVRIYVAVNDANRDRVAAALAPSGARFIQLDPAKAIPQRHERILLHNGQIPP